MNELKRKILLKYVQRQIKKMQKQYKWENRRAHTAWLNELPTGKPSYSIDTGWEIYDAAFKKWKEEVQRPHEEARNRLDQLLRWEYSLKTVNNVTLGEDVSHWPRKLKEYRAAELAYNPDHVIRARTLPADRPILHDHHPDYADNRWHRGPTKFWTKDVNGERWLLSDEDYQALRKRAGLPPRTYGHNPNADEQDRKWLEKHGRTSK